MPFASLRRPLHAHKGKPRLSDTRRMDKDADVFRGTRRSGRSWSRSLRQQTRACHWTTQAGRSPLTVSGEARVAPDYEVQSWNEAGARFGIR